MTGFGFTIVKSPLQKGSNYSQAFSNFLRYKIQIHRDHAELSVQKIEQLIICVTPILAF